MAAADPAVWRWMTVHGHEAGRLPRLVRVDARERGGGASRRRSRSSCARRGEPVGSSRYLTLRPEHRGLEIGWTWHRAARVGHGRQRRGEAPPARARVRARLGCMRVEFKTDALNERARARARGDPRALRGHLPQAHARPRRRAPRLGLVQRRRRRVAGRAGLRCAPRVQLEAVSARRARRRAPGVAAATTRERPATSSGASSNGGHPGGRSRARARGRAAAPPRCRRCAPASARRPRRRGRPPGGRARARASP